jgi:hypothetical protein
MRQLATVALLLVTVALAGCTTSTPVTTATQPATVRSVAETGQGGTDAVAAQFFGLAVSRPSNSQTPLATWTLPASAGGEVERPVLTLRRTYDPATGALVSESYDQQVGPDGRPLTERVAAGLFIDARGSSFSNSASPQGAVEGSGTTQSGTAAPAATQTTTTTQTTSVPVTADVAVTLPNGATVPAGGVIPAGTPLSVFPAGATLTPVGQ